MRYQHAMITTRDNLTGLLDADAARACLALWQKESSQDSGIQPSLMLIGLRRFQTVNLAYGEDIGDLALAEVARRLRLFADDELDGPWMLARMGGRDFLLASKEPCSASRWQWLAEEACANIADPLAMREGALRLSSRVALLQAQPDEDVAVLMDRLSQALNDAHQQSAGLSVWSDPAQVANQAAVGRSAAALEGDLHHAISRGEIALLYQPQFAFADDRLCGAEVLARWQHPLLGRVGAGLLFSVAERTDYIRQLSRHIAERALNDTTRWTAGPLAGLRLSLNVTAADLADRDFLPIMRQLICQTGFEPGRLTLEITEQALVADLVRSAEALRALREDGVRIAIDDFGTGYSSLQHLKVLPIDQLKLDHAMTADIASTGKGRIIVRAIIAMARDLGLDVLAEGVETQAQHDLLAEAGCSYYQGFLHGRPMAIDALEALAED